MPTTEDHRREARDAMRKIMAERTGKPLDPPDDDTPRPDPPERRVKAKAAAAKKEAARRKAAQREANEAAVQAAHDAMVKDAAKADEESRAAAIVTEAGKERDDG